MNTLEMQEKTRMIKSRIEKLLESGHLKEAKDVIEAYMKNIPGDLEMVSIYAVALIMEGFVDKAESVILEGLRKDSFHFDLLYNLAYIYESAGRYKDAAELYMKSSSVAVTQDRYIATAKNKPAESFCKKSGFDDKIGSDFIYYVNDKYTKYPKHIIVKEEQKHWQVGI